MNNFEQQQKRIAFLSLHRDLVARLKPITDFTVKDHDGLKEYAYVLMNELFKKYPIAGNKSTTEITKEEPPY